LAAGDRHSAVGTVVDLGLIESVLAAHCFIQHVREVTIDGGARAAVSAKAIELWMVAITLGVAHQYVPREQAFAPQSHQALCVEELWVNGPESQSPRRYSRALAVCQGLVLSLRHGNAEVAEAHEHPGKGP
jgi:hypothetical protein